MSAEPIIHYERLIAPLQSGGVLLEPSGAQLVELAGAKHDAALQAVPLLDGTIGGLRADMRKRIGLRGPVIVVGHQAEFFHPGVLAKLMAGDLLACKTGGACLFLIADSDTPKSAHLSVPRQVNGEWIRARFAIPGVGLGFPDEYRMPAPLEAWRSFFAEIQTAVPLIPDSLLDACQNAWLAPGEAAAAGEIDYFQAFQRALAAAESHLDLPGATATRMSLLAETAAFRAFFLHIAADARRFAVAYNEALAAFRERHRVRTPARPAPALLINEARIELPFWLDRLNEPRRRAFVAVSGAAIQVFAEDQRIGEFPRSPRLAVCGSTLLPGWDVRPRALTLSAFVRLFVGDLFIHGIGGAKYDEVTTAFVRDFWGVEAPPIACVTATLPLPLPAYGVTLDDLAKARWRTRDFAYNPQRYVADIGRDLSVRRAALIEKSNELRRSQPRDRAARRRVFEDIQTLRAEIVAAHPAEQKRLVEQERELQQRWEQDRITRDREYFFGLHSIAALRALTARLQTELEQP